MGGAVVGMRLQVRRDRDEKSEGRHGQRLMGAASLTKGFGTGLKKSYRSLYGVGEKGATTVVFLVWTATLFCRV